MFYGMQLLHVYHFTQGQACYSILDDSGVNEDEIWINGIGFTQQKNDNFGDGGKTTHRSPPDNLKQWIITKSGDFTGRSMER